MNILELRDIDASYGAVRVLSQVSLTVPQGAIVALLGANGAGKTTTLRTISNMMVKATGVRRFLGRDIGALPTEKITRLGLGHIPDGRGTFLGFSVDENLRLGAHGRAAGDIGADMERMFGYFPRLRERRRQQAGTLSGGEQQMLAISRALMGAPKLLLLDEPSFGLAPLVVREIFGILREINRAEGLSMLLVEQNARLALDLAHQACLLETGRVALAGASDALASDDAVRRAYLGH